MSSWHPNYFEGEDNGLNPTETVYEKKEKKLSSLLDHRGNPIPYESKKLGFVGFYKLKEN